MSSLTTCSYDITDKLINGIKGKRGSRRSRMKINIKLLIVCIKDKSSQ
jgi:hypothetical protein